MVLLAKGLPKERFQVEVAALTRLGPLEHDLRDAGIPVTLIGKRHKVDPFALRTLTRFLKGKQFDIVQTWLFAANSYGRIAARRAKTPAVIATEMAVDLWKGRWESAIDRLLSNSCDRVVGNSKAVVDFYRTRGIPENKLECIYSGIGAVKRRASILSRSGASSAGRARRRSRFSSAAWRPKKGSTTYCVALDLLRHVRPLLRTLIVGEGPERGRLEELARAFELQEFVRFLGHRDDVPRFLSGADMLVLPSLYEGLPNVALEAMRFSKPVVATDAPGTSEAVEHEKTGLLTPVRDFKELARAIRQLVDDPDLGRRLGLAGLERVDREFRVETMVDRFATLYESIAMSKNVNGRSR